MPGGEVIGGFRVMDTLCYIDRTGLHQVEEVETGRKRGLLTMHGVGIEVLMVKAIQHPRIVQFLSTGVDGQVGFIVTDHIETTVDNWIGKVGALDPWWASEVVRCVGEGLAAGPSLISRGTTLSPKEIVFMADGHGGAAVKMFGRIPHAAPGPEDDPVWSLMLFASPESFTQSLGQLSGPVAHVWTLGLMAFYAFTGRHFWPAGDDNYSLLQKQVLTEPLPSASNAARGMGVEALLPRGFDAWFARCIQRDPAQRWQTTTEALAHWRSDPDEEALFMTMRRPDATTALRSIYADWLERHGEGARAAWLRSRL